MDRRAGLACGVCLCARSRHLTNPVVSNRSQVEDERSRDAAQQRAARVAQQRVGRQARVPAVVEGESVPKDREWWRKKEADGEGERARVVQGSDGGGGGTA
eukprot:scaffold7738_cov107-Isochrysis_galbana.AAC.21